MRKIYKIFLLVFCSFIIPLIPLNDSWVNCLNAQSCPDPQLDTVVATSGLACETRTSRPFARVTASVNCSTIGGVLLGCGGSARGDIFLGTASSGNRCQAFIMDDDDNGTSECVRAYAICGFVR